MLTAAQIQRLSDLANAGDRIGYYSYLNSFGSRYASLALGVVENSTLSGQTANAYAMLAHDGKQLAGNVELGQVGIELMNLDMRLRSSTGQLDLSVDQIETYHKDVFEIHSMPASTWTAYTPLQVDSSTREQYWGWMLDGNNAAVVAQMTYRAVGGETAR